VCKKGKNHWGERGGGGKEEEIHNPKGLTLQSGATLGGGNEKKQKAGGSKLGVRTGGLHTATKKRESDGMEGKGRGVLHEGVKNFNFQLTKKK